MRWLVDARPLVSPGTGGVARVSRELVRACVAAAPDDEWILATTGSHAPSTDHFPQTPNARHIHIKLPNKLWSVGSIARLFHLDTAIEKRVGRIDATFLPNLGFTGPLIRPYTLLLHDLSFLVEPRWFSFKMRLWHQAVRPKMMIRNASRLLAVSHRTARDASRLLSIAEDSIHVLPMGSSLVPMPSRSQIETKTISLAELAIKKDLQSDSPLSLSPHLSTRGRYALALGGGDRRKNVTTAIIAVERLRCDQNFHDLKLVIVGTLPSFKSYSKSQSWIEIVERPSDQTLNQLYRHAAVFLYPSWYEGYGFPLHEATSRGVACIASTAGALPETAPPGTLFADPAKPHHWTEALRIALSKKTIFTVKQPSKSWDEAAKMVIEGLQQ